MTTLVNGQASTNLQVADRGLQYGDGLFETLALRNGDPLLWDRHIQRLGDGCRRLGLPAPEASLLREEVTRIAESEAHAVAKIILTRGTAGRGYRVDASGTVTRIVQHLPWPAYPDAAGKEGVTVRWCETRLARQPRLAGMKHLNRLEQVLARAEWQDDYAEGLMCDTDGLVIEGTMTNLFLVRADGTVVTPDLSQSGVAGVMRAQVLDSAAAMGMNCIIQAVTTDMVESAQELFLTNSLIGIWPIRRIEARHYVVGQISQTLQAALHAADCLA
ncbi:MAG: aminodeoxychorismate lyase [Pseudomonadota bacterium]